MEKQRKRTMQQLQSDLDNHIRMCAKSNAREEFLLNIVRQFHLEVESWGLELQSQAVKDSMCIYASDWQCSIDMHLEAAKRQEGE